MLDGLAQRFLLRLPQGGGIGLVEAAGMFAVGTEHVHEDRRGHLAAPRLGVLGDRPQQHPAGEGGIGGRVMGGEAGCSAGAQALDRGADHDVRQRYAFGSPDDRGYDAHAPPNGDFCRYLSIKAPLPVRVPENHPEIGVSALFWTGAVP